MEKMWLIKDFKVPLPAERSLWWNPHQGKYLRFDVSQKYAVETTLLCPGDWLGDLSSFICFKWLWTHDTRESGSVRDKPKPEWLFPWWIHSSSFQRCNMTCSSSMIMERHDYASPLSEHPFFLQWTVAITTEYSPGTGNIIAYLYQLKYPMLHT